MDAKQYLDYLDKEMTIMGILSAFSVTAPAAILGAAIAKDSGIGVFWAAEPASIIFASILCVLAAFLFYKQRSDLAWYYGQICLTSILGGHERKVAAELREWLKDADSWATWWPYCWGFTFLVAGFIAYLLCILYWRLHTDFQAQWQQINRFRLLAFGVLTVVVVVTLAKQYYVRTRYPFSDSPWRDFLSDVGIPVRKASVTLPHHGVYTRLKPSPIHGIGVFAILDIPKDEYIFEPDNDLLTTFPIADVEELPPTLGKMYRDFCVPCDHDYLCPSNLNRLTPSWFLNNSRTPNVAADTSLKFYALRDIAAGAELTVDYSTYSEMQEELVDSDEEVLATDRP